MTGRPADDDVLAALRTSPLFDQLPDAVISGLAAGGETVEVAAGAVLMAEGEPSDSLVVVLDGELEVTRSGGGAHVLLNVCTRGDLLGELGVLQGLPRSATVRSRTAARVRRIGADALDRMLDHPRTARALLSAVTRRLAREEALLRQRERMAALGSLAAGLLHEVNNPAAAIARSAARLRALHAGEPRGGPLAALVGTPDPDPLARADAASAVADVLRWCAPALTRADAGQLADLGMDPAALGEVLSGLPEEQRADAVRDLLRDAERTALLDELAIGAEHLSRIVSGVRPLAYSADQGLIEVDVHAGLEQALVLVRHKLPPGVDVVRDLDPAAQFVQGRAADLALVWVNLLDNAVDAVGERGTITLRTRPVGDRVQVDVENTGPPVSPAVLERAFDAFFTTKQVGEGTGLGLATSLAVVSQQHGGRLSLSSADGVTRAQVVLPRRT